MSDGICPTCNTRPRVTGRSYCLECGREWQNKNKKSHPQQYTEEQREQQRARARERHARRTPEEKAAYRARRNKNQAAWLEANPEIRERRNREAVIKKTTWTPERHARQKKIQKEHYLRTRARPSSGKCGYSSNCNEPPIGDYKYCVMHWCKSMFLAHDSRVKSEYTADDLVALWKKQEGKCAITGLELIPGKTAALDHIIPIDKGGNGTIGNVRLVHTDFNRIKWNKTDEELKRFVLEFIPLVTKWAMQP